MPASPIDFLSNGSATTTAKFWNGGPGVFACVGTFGGATVTLQGLAPDGTTWIAVNSSAALTSNGAVAFTWPSGSLRVLVSGGAPSALYARAAFSEGGGGGSGGGGDATAANQTTQITAEQAIQTKLTHGTTGTQTSVSSATSSTTILASNANRKGAVITNDDANVLYLLLGAGTASTTNYSIQLAGNGGSVSIGLAEYSGIISGIWAADGSGAARVTEFT